MALVPIDVGSAQADQLATAHPCDRTEAQHRSDFRREPKRLGQQHAEFLHLWWRALS